ncbi:NADPH:quinone oxidoreductase family protein [Qipengyuania gaetbuli]|uniref:NADPH:quinone oxidoreductase family protein n=1 Tax=Qipengyuania gaetbuli TaxID=266952 RepID=UPI001CD49756|nr:NADPH:quinone oxidoreductase family protein [Qipengyuania gaetbuli]MCA0911158.1 NADPH:quinone oxidoreductase family protein [Qipengyuania gaetbuli]
MKALVVRSLSSDLSGTQIEDIADPVREERQVLVRVRAASLNYPDLLMTRGTYQFKPDVPFVSGLEMAGEVVEADEGSGFTPGDRVMGGAKTGAFAEFVALPVSSLRPVPAGLGFPDAAAMGAAYHTAYVALVELGRLEEGQTVLVHGASGGVGLAACDLAKALGARVIAASHREDKLAVLERIAAPDAAVLNTGRFREEVAELTGGKLCDLVFDPIGGDVFDESTRCVAFGGKLLVVGFVAGRIPEIAVNIPLIKGFSVVGVRAGEYARRFPDRAKRIAAELGRLASEGRISPHIERTLPLARWREAFEAMEAGEIVGKIVLEP